MKTSKTNLLLIWAVIILLATNISMAVSFIYHKNQNPQLSETPIQTQMDIPAENRTRFFREQLNLSPEQMQPFREFNRNYNHSAKNITNQLALLRMDMVTELGKKNTDDQLIDTITLQIGELHKELKALTVRYYQNMDSECNDQQRKKLNDLFLSVLNRNEDVRLPKSGKGKRLK